MGSFHDAIRSIIIDIKLKKHQSLRRVILKTTASLSFEVLSGAFLTSFSTNVITTSATLSTFRGSRQTANLAGFKYVKPTYFGNPYDHILCSFL